MGAFPIFHSKLRRPGFNATQTFGLIGLLWGQARRRARSWPFDSGKSAFCTIFRAEHAPLPRICYYKGKSLGSDNPGRLNVELHLVDLYIFHILYRYSLWSSLHLWSLLICVPLCLGEVGTTSWYNLESALSFGEAPIYFQLFSIKCSLESAPCQKQPTV